MLRGEEDVAGGIHRVDKVSGAALLRVDPLREAGMRGDDCAGLQPQNRKSPVGRHPLVAPARLTQVGFVTPVPCQSCD